MPQALGQTTRQQIWALRADGKSKSAVARALGISLKSVQRILARGVDRIAPGYGRCGPGERKYAETERTRAVELKRAHPGWGAGYIQLELKAQKQAVPSRRTLQRWFQAAQVNRPRERRPTRLRSKGQVVHAMWEVDAKEQVRLGDQSQASVLMAVDEASGAVVGATAFPPRVVQRGGRASGTGSLTRFV